MIPAFGVPWTATESITIALPDAVLDVDRRASRGAGRGASAARCGAVGGRRRGRRSPRVPAPAGLRPRVPAARHRDPAPQGRRPAAVQALADRPLDRERRRRLSAARSPSTAASARLGPDIGDRHAVEEVQPRQDERARRVPPRRRLRLHVPRARPPALGTRRVASTRRAGASTRRRPTPSAVSCATPRGCASASTRATGSPATRAGRRTGCASRRAACTARMLEQRVIPYFDGMARLRLAEIEPRDVKAFVRWMVEQDDPRNPGRRLAKSTVRQHVAVLRAMLGDATEEGLIRSNPAAGVRIAVPEGDGTGRPCPSDKRAMTIEELQRLMAEVPERWRLFFEFLAHTGLRIGEASEVRWGRDLVFGERPYVKLRWQFADGRVCEPKSRYGKRDIPLSPGLVRKLRAVEPPESDGELVFTSRRGTRLDRHNLMYKVLAPAARRAGVPWVTLHTLPPHVRVVALRAGRAGRRRQERQAGPGVARAPLAGVHAQGVRPPRRRGRRRRGIPRRALHIARRFALRRRPGCRCCVLADAARLRSAATREARARDAGASRASAEERTAASSTQAETALGSPRGDRGWRRCRRLRVLGGRGGRPCQRSLRPLRRWSLSLSRPARRLTWVGGRSRPAPAGILARSPIPTTHSPLKGRSGGRDRFKGSRSRGGTRAEGPATAGLTVGNSRTEDI